jgi:hypothetical protein
MYSISTYISLGQENFWSTDNNVSVQNGAVRHRDISGFWIAALYRAAETKLRWFSREIGICSQATQFVV